MITSVCTNCGAAGCVRYPTFCDVCGLEIVEIECVNLDIANNKQRHYHPKCVPAFTVTLKCSICKAIAGPHGRVVHDPEKHGDKRAALQTESRD